MCCNSEYCISTTSKLSPMMQLWKLQTAEILRVNYNISAAAVKTAEILHENWHFWCNSENHRNTASKLSLFYVSIIKTIKMVTWKLSLLMQLWKWQTAEILRVNNISAAAVKTLHFWCNRENRRNTASKWSVLMQNIINIATELPYLCCIRKTASILSLWL